MNKIYVVSASWCSQCGPYKQALEKAGIEFESVDADDESNEMFLHEMNVRGLPTTIIFRGEVHVGNVVGNNVPKVKELLNV